MPERAARMFDQVSTRPMPTGETMPIPVMTTRRLDMAWVKSSEVQALTASAGNRAGCAHPARSDLLLDVGSDVIDRLLHGGDLLRVLVGNLRLEFLLERHHQFYGVQRVSPKIVHEG